MAKKQMVEEKQAKVGKKENQGRTGDVPDGLPGLAGLQKMIGNQAVQRFLARRGSEGSLKMRHDAASAWLRNPRLLTVQRQAVVQRSGGPATITGAPAGSVTKVCLFRLTGTSARYIENARQYILNTLGVDQGNLIDVDSLAHMFASLRALGTGNHVNRLIIVSHGREVTITDAVTADQGQVQQQSGWITPEQVSAAADTPDARAVRSQVLAPGAIVEFWGCRLGGSVTAMGSWGRATLPGQGSEFRASTERMGFDYFTAQEFFRQVQRDGESVRVRITNTSQVPAGREAAFRQRLLGIYPQMVASHEIVEQTPPRTEAQRYSYMSDLYNRSEGRIRTMRLTPQTGPDVAPSSADWPSLWQTQRFNVANLFE